MNSVKRNLAVVGSFIGKRRSCMLLMLASVGLFVFKWGAQSGAQPFRAVTLIPPPTRELALLPKERGGRLYGQAAGMGLWHVGQWNNPGPELPDFADGRTSNGSLTFQVENTEPVAFTIIHDGSALHCAGSAGQPLESDAFIGADKSAARAFPLSGLRAIYYTIQVSNEGVTPVWSEQGSCSTSKAVGMAAIVLTNRADSSTLFYQVLLFTVGMTPHSFWYRQGRGND